MSTKRLAFVLVVFAATSAIAGATCIVRHRQAIVVNQAAVVAPAVVPVVTVPAYSASYDDKAALGNQVADLQKRLSAAEARVAILETARDTHTKRLADLEAKLGLKPAAEVAPPPAPKAEEAAKPAGIPALYARSCQQCHNSTKASGGLVLVGADGKLAPITPVQALAVLRRINLQPEDRDVMPPKKSGHQPASDAEAAEVTDVVTKTGK